MAQCVNIYFVASPLQYLVARAIRDKFEAGTRQILVWYKRGVEPVVVKEDWDAAIYMPWPRFEPLPGLFGRHRRLLDNIKTVAALVGRCETLNIHSAVFDTEAINYFLRALPVACRSEKMSARILPDGIISVRRYPLSGLKRLLQYLKKVRRLADPQLNYWCFSGDRIGSDAPFCDRIYVLPGLPHEYPPDKVVVLPPLVNRIAPDVKSVRKRALVVGQPLVGAGLLGNKTDLGHITQEINGWLMVHQFELVDYKCHPKDPNLELCLDSYNILHLKEPLEIWMSKTHYDAVIGVRSSALLFARQIYSPDTEVIAFGWDRIKFKSGYEYNDMKNVFVACGVQLHDNSRIRCMIN